MAKFSSHILNGSDGSHASNIKIKIYQILSSKSKKLFLNTKTDINGRVNKIFNITKKDIEFLRSLVINKYINQKNTLVFLESGDEVLNYVEAAKYYRGSNIDITIGGNHSYESITKKLQKIVKFIEIQ